MGSSIEELDRYREGLINEMFSLGEFRRGTITVNYRKCGKGGCHCAPEGARGHVQYLWNAAIGGKVVVRNLHLGPEVEKYIEETERYKKFIDLCKKLVEVNERLCDEVPVEKIEDEQELDELKKKLRKRLLKRRVRR